MKHPEQIYIPGTEPVRGPCDDALSAWQDSMEAAADAAAEKKRKRDELLDRMQQTGTSRVAYVDRKTQKRKWLEITADPKLRTVAAEQEHEHEPGGGERPRGRRTSRSTETPDPFAATREQMAGVPETRDESRQGRVSDPKSHDTAGQAENAATPPVAQESGSDAASPGLDLLKPGQRRRARGVR